MLSLLFVDELGKLGVAWPAGDAGGFPDCRRLRNSSIPKLSLISTVATVRN